MITRAVEIDIKLTPYEAAEAFCGFDSEEQALFFDSVGVIAAKWASGLEFQLEAVIAENNLTKTAIDTMRMIGEYGNAINF